MLLKICRLLYEDLLPRASGEGARFANILKDEERMSAVFGAFVGNFYRREQSEFSAGSELISRDATAPEQEHTAYLPMMRTDVTLRFVAETVVIGTKYYRKTLSTHMRSEKIWSSHLYQIFAYLKNLERAGGNDARARGILLYPTVGRALNVGYEIGGHLISAVTVDLNEDWPAIHQNLLNILQPHSSSADSPPKAAANVDRNL
ncbi:hypothetical protein JO965_45595 (plasmid) [Microvirga sp. VF16]|nr:hypothetical protein JO965_45595 [Microvirga sp. VF16]